MTFITKCKKYINLLVLMKINPWNPQPLEVEKPSIKSVTLDQKQIACVRVCSVIFISIVIL